MGERFVNQSWKDSIRQVEQGCDQLLHYCIENQDWLKAIEANELLTSKNNGFAQLLQRFATRSMDPSQQKPAASMFGSSSPGDAAVPPLPPGETRGITMPAPLPTPPPGSAAPTTPPPSALSLLQMKAKLRPEAPVFLMPRKEESLFARGTEASMAKIRKAPSSGNVLSSKDAKPTNELRGSQEGRKAGNPSAPASAGASGRKSSGPSTSLVLPPPAIAPTGSEEKDDWEEKVKAEMQAATEQLWQVTEAWVDAEAEVEELEWRILELGIGRYVGLIDAPIDVDETEEGKLEVKSAKKEKLLLDTAFQNVDDTTYWAVRHPDRSPAERRQTRYSTPSKASDYTSPLQGGLGSALGPPRALHSKLSSPDRKRSMTPTEAMRKLEAKMTAAEVNRDRTVNEKVQKAQLVSFRVKQRNEKEAERLSLAGEALQTKLQSAQQRHTDYINFLKGRAGSENAKVNDVITSNSLNSEAVSQQLQQKLEEVEARILAANLRREQRLAGISGSQRKKNTKKAQQMSEFRLQLERVKMDRWEKIQRRIEAVQERRRVRFAEMKRRAEDEAAAYHRRDDSEVGTPAGMTPYSTPGGNRSSESVDFHEAVSGVTHGHGHDVGLLLSDGGSGSPQRLSAGGELILDDAAAVAGAAGGVMGESAPGGSDALFDFDDWAQVAATSLYSDVQSAAALAYKLFSESLAKPKIHRLRQETWTHALRCLSCATMGLYRQYHADDVLPVDSTASSSDAVWPLQAVLMHLVELRQQRASQQIIDDERDASSFNLYCGLLADIAEAGGLFQLTDAVEKVNVLVTGVCNAALSADFVSGGRAVEDFIASGGLLLLAVALSDHFGVLSVQALEARWLLECRWFLREDRTSLSSAHAGGSSNNNPLPRLELRTVLRLVRAAMECVDDELVLAGCAWPHVLGDLAFYLSLVVYRGGCEVLTFRATDSIAGQKLQEIFGETISLWSLCAEKMISLTQEAQRHASTLYIFHDARSLPRHIRLDDTAATANHNSNSNNSNSASNCNPGTLSAEQEKRKALLEEVLLSYFQYSFMCQDLANLFTSLHVAVLAVQVSLEENFLTWRKLEKDASAAASASGLPSSAFAGGSGGVSARNSHRMSSSSAAAAAAASVPVSASSFGAVVNHSFIKLLDGAASYVSTLTLFIRWCKVHSAVQFHTLARHWWSLLRKANVMQFLYSSFLFCCKHLYTAVYCTPMTTMSSSDLESLLQCALHMVQTMFALVQVDIEAFRHLNSSQRGMFLFGCNVFMLLLTKIIDSGKDNITDEVVHSALLRTLPDELVQHIKLVSETCLHYLLLLLTLISARDVETRKAFSDRHVLEDASKLEEHMRQRLLAAQEGGRSLLHSLCHTPPRYFKSSRVKHSLCLCVVAACLELEQHRVIVRTAGRERYLQRFVEFILKELDGGSSSGKTAATAAGAVPGSASGTPTASAAAAAAAAGDESATGDARDVKVEKDEPDDDRKRRQQIERSLVLIPEEYWRNVVSLMWPAKIVAVSSS